MTTLTSLLPKEGFEFLNNNPDALLIDVRSSMEFLFVGHPIGAIHIAWIDEPDWEVNPNFVIEVERALGKVSIHKRNTPIILICRSGKRSKLAGELLIKNGFANVSHISEGFEGERNESYQRGTVGGWRFHHLPWEQC